MKKINMSGIKDVFVDNKKEIIMGVASSIVGGLAIGALNKLGKQEESFDSEEYSIDEEVMEEPEVEKEVEEK